MTQAELLKAAMDKKAAKATADFCIKLGQFLNDNNICRSHISAESFIHDSSLCVILNGKGNPECDTIMKILIAGKVEVTFKKLP